MGQDAPKPTVPMAGALHPPPPSFLSLPAACSLSLAASSSCCRYIRARADRLDRPANSGWPLARLHRGVRRCDAARHIRGTSSDILQCAFTLDCNSLPTGAFQGGRGVQHACSRTSRCSSGSRMALPTRPRTAVRNFALTTRRIARVDMPYLQIRMR